MYQTLASLLKALFFLTSVFFVLQSSAQTPDANGIVYVKTTGAGNGSSWQNATNNLQAAIVATGAQKVFVEIGTYNVSGTGLFMKDNVAIYGGFDPDNGIDDLSDDRILPSKDAWKQGSVLDGNYLNTIINNNFSNSNPLGNTAVLDGFFLYRGESQTNGGGIFNNYASPTLRNLVITYGYAINGDGGGMYNNHSSPALTNVEIVACRAARGGGMANIYSEPTLLNCKININISYGADGGGGMYNDQSPITAINTTIVQNTCYNSTNGGGGIRCSNSNGILLNTTISSNSPNSIYISSGSLRLRNSVVYGGTYGMAIDAQYCLIAGSTNTSNGNLNDDEINFYSVFASDFLLRPNSPLIDKGNNSFYSGLDQNSKDLSGGKRLSGSTIDIGAYEFRYLPNFNGIIYVKEQATGAGIGNSWADAISDLQVAIDAEGTKKVFVAKGTYDVTSSSFVMKNGVAIYGGFDPDNGIDDLGDKRILPAVGTSQGSILNGRNERPVIWNSENGLSPTALLDGFTVTNGSGSGIYNSFVSPSFNNLLITENTGINGGGIRNNYSFPSITNTVITANTASNNGGAMVDTESSPTLTNVLIYGNTAANFTGGIYHISGTSTLRNVTIANNTPSSLYAAGGWVYLNNSINYGTIQGSAYSASYSIIQGSSNTSDGNINATSVALDDLFKNHTAENYLLKRDSPAVNKGSNALYPEITSQTIGLGGLPRLTGSLIDIGAYELEEVIPNATGTVFVKTVASGDQTGFDWANATGNLQKAIDAPDTKSVMVASGTYPVSENSFIMREGVAIYGGFDPDNGISELSDNRLLPNPENLVGSILNGQHERPVIWNYNNGLTSAALLDGFTIFQGSGINGGGIYNRDVSPSFSNLVLKENTSTNGGAIYNENSSPSLTNVAMVNNTASEKAGAFYSLSGNPVFTNVTIANNTPDAVHDNASSLVVNNSIIYGGLVGAPLSTSYSLVEGSSDISNGNVDATGINLTDVFTNPSMMNFTPLRCAPVINSGTPDTTGLHLPTRDLAGNPRLFGDRIDMGAYETTEVPSGSGIAEAAVSAIRQQTDNGTTHYFNSCNELIASVTSPNNANGIQGNTTTRIWIDDVQASNYVKRHYEITPATNAESSSGRITLYFTQADFDAFNVLNNATPLPEAPTDADGIANLLIEKRGGVSSDGTGRPATYPGAVETISNVEVEWNSDKARWEVSFQVESFSGFFVKTNESSLPVRWLSFSGKLDKNNHAALAWKVDETNVDRYEVERSADAEIFRQIAVVKAIGNGLRDYAVTDPLPTSGWAYYRIRQVDGNGQFSDSKIIGLLGPDKKSTVLYPNPFRDQLTIEVDKNDTGTSLDLINSSGVVVKKVEVRAEKTIVETSDLSPGIYLLQRRQNTVLKLLKE